jgi:glycosyltransferase involved in cell wall biosynthesis
MPQASISVIIPTRNEEKLLRRCLEQFTKELLQRFAIEIIVSDGGSTDATLTIASEYTNLIAKHEDISNRQTIAEGRNHGAMLASGDILVFLNADTQIPEIPKFFDRILNRMSSDPALVALAVKVQVIPEERKLSDILFHGFFNQYVHILNFFGMGMGRGECQIVRRNAFDTVTGYNESLPAGEDFDLYNRLRRIGKVKYDGKLLVFESPRRYRKYGYAKVYFDWVKNGFSVLFTKKASSTVWEDVR